MNTQIDEMVISTTWTDKDWDKFTKWIKGMLKVDTVTVTFTKKDGNERVMECTLDPKLLPSAPVTESKREKKSNPDVLAVYDVKAQGWRSFAIKSVKSVNIKIG